MSKLEGAQGAQLSLYRGWWTCSGMQWSERHVTDRSDNDSRSRTSNRPDVAIIAGKHRVGRVQSQCKRALLAHNGGPVLISEFLRWAFPRADSYARWMRWSVHRALPKFAVPTGRYASLRGRPVAWIARPELMRLIRPKST